MKRFFGDAPTAGQRAFASRAKSSLWLDICVDNLAEIACFFGDGIAGRLLAETYARVEVALPHGLRLAELLPGGVRAPCDSLNANDLEQILVATGRSFTFDEVTVVPAVSCKLIDGRTKVSPRTPLASFEGAGQFREDMAVAAAVQAAIEAGQLHLFMQPVVILPDSVSHDASPLYGECLSRIFTGEGAVAYPDIFIPALERLGLTRYFDRHVVLRTIDLLRTQPELSLGCNVSPLSAVADEWWTQILATLASEPSLANRLVIELSQSALSGQGGQAMTFIKSMRQLGCRIAIDGFGVGYAAADFIRTSDVDIVKVDRRFVKYRTERADEIPILTHLVALAQSLAPEIVIEGIEEQDDLACAARAGAKWAQGYFLGGPVPFVQPDSQGIL